MNKTHAYNELDGVKLSKEKVSNLAEFIKLIICSKMANGVKIVSFKTFLHHIIMP